MRKNHWLVKEDDIWLHGRSLGRPHPPRYYITERYITSEGNEARRFIASFGSEEDRDNIFAAMEHAGLCSHRKLPSWVRSIHGVEDGWIQMSKRRWEHGDRLRVINREGELYKTEDPHGPIYCGRSLAAAMEARREQAEEEQLLAKLAEIEARRK